MKGIKKIKYSEYNQRTEEETQKYFKESGKYDLKTDTADYVVGGDLEEYRLSYLTPSVIEIEGEQFSLNGKDKNQLESTEYNKISFKAKNVRRTNKRFKEPIKLADESKSGQIEEDNLTVLQKELQETFSKFGVSVRGTSKDRVESGKIICDCIEQEGAQFINLFEIPITEGASIDNDEKKDKKEKDKNVALLFTTMNSVAVAEDEKKDKFTKPKSKALNLQSENNLIDKSHKYKSGEISKESKSSMIQSLPNQLKALVLSSTKDGKRKVKQNWFDEIDLDNPKNSSLYYLNFVDIKRVEYLHSFKKTLNEKTLIKKPVWKLLKDKDIRDLLEKTNNSYVLCRIRNYENPKLGIKIKKDLDLPIYNRYFLLDIEEIRVALPEEEVEAINIEFKKNTVKKNSGFYKVYDKLNKQDQIKKGATKTNTTTIVKK